VQRAFDLKGLSVRKGVVTVADLSEEMAAALYEKGILS
jgi:hypothetical protein